RNGLGWYIHQAERRALAGLLLRTFTPKRCRSRRESNFHLLALERRRRTHQQLGRAVRNAPQIEVAIRWLNGWSHDVRAAVQYGADRIAHGADWCTTHGLAVRGREHA